MQGAAQKGPFVLGSTVQVAMVDDAGNPTGAVFNASTRNDLGEFELVLSTFGTVEIITTGFYFNEYTGDLSGSNITLRALGRIEASGMQSIYINLVTHLAETRAKELLSQGTAFDAAVAQAEGELRASLPIAHPAEASAGAGISMNVLGGDSADNQYLFVVSCVLGRAAALEAASDREVDAKLQELVNTIALDLEADGALAPELVDRIDYAERTLDPGRCAANLAAWLDEQGSALPVPDSTQSIDSDSDGEPNAQDPDDDGDGVDDGADPDPSTPCVGFCDGICRDLFADTAHCGACDVACDPTQADTCADGACACGGGSSCEGTPSSACCYGECMDLTTGGDDPDPEGGLANCGACGRSCDVLAADRCIDGECACGGGPACAGTPSDLCCMGQCVDTLNDPAHCGGCQPQHLHECWHADNTGCVDGACVCGDDAGCSADLGEMCCPGIGCVAGGDCNEWGECVPGQVGSEDCGLGQTRTRTCGDNGEWGAWSACGGGECAPGQVQSEDCGLGQTRTRTCGDNGEWGAWSACGGGECAPGTTESQGCGQCGVQDRTCDDLGLWGAWGACAGEGACSPGASVMSACGACGTQTRTCEASCNWGAWGACTGEGVCTPGANEQSACGLCGSQSRTCDAFCSWGGWGACAGEGVCTPGATEQAPCGVCGTQSRTCDGSCSWGGWGACVDPCG